MKLFLFTILFPLLLLSQDNRELQITYNVLGSARVYEEISSSNGKIIVSTTNPSELKGSRIETETGFSTVRAGKFPKYTYYKKISSNEVFIKVGLEKPIILKDVLPNVEWNISSSESKVIGDYKCQLATATYRGSDVYAYFTTEIPLSLGPWKFYGLPGAILECGTTDLINQWMATSIIFKDASVNQAEWDFNFNGNYVSFKDIVIESRLESIEETKRKHAKLPKGVAVTTTYTREGVEKIYEWELEESDKQ